MLVTGHIARCHFDHSVMLHHTSSTRWLFRSMRVYIPTGISLGCTGYDCNQHRLTQTMPRQDISLYGISCGVYTLCVWLDWIIM